MDALCFRYYMRAKWNTVTSETVFLGDTVISLHTLQLHLPRVGAGLRYSGVVKTQSPKSWPNFHFEGEGAILE